MKEKEIRIIEAAMKLFAKKGYSSTSIQEIANECEISKGAFYLYFKSKESLLLATFEYYFDLIFEKMNALNYKDLSPRERFVVQLANQLDEVKKYKEFIIMQTREQAIPLNKEVAKFIQRLSIEGNRFYQNSLLSIYGDQIKEYSNDLVVIAQGITQSYTKLIIFDKVEIDLNELSQFILRRIDSIVEGLISSNENPILSSELLVEFQALCFNPTKEDLLNEIEKYKNDYSPETDFYITLDVLGSEIASESPRTPVIQGMLANFNNEPKLLTLQNQIATFFDIEMK